MTNKLATHLTTWKAWYAVLAIPAFLFGSVVSILGGFAEGLDDTTRQTLTAC